MENNRMGNAIVIYKSKYGATEQYAKWIAEELQCAAVPIDQVKKADLKDYDTIVYGGGVQAGGIKELDKFLKWQKVDLKIWEMYRNGKLDHEDLVKSGVHKRKIVVFACGINLDDEAARQQLLEINFPKAYQKNIPCFYMPGEYHPERLDKIEKFIMNTAEKILRGKSEVDVTENDRKMLDYMQHGCNLINKERIRPLIQEVTE